MNTVFADTSVYNLWIGQDGRCCVRIVHGPVLRFTVEGDLADLGVEKDEAADLDFSDTLKIIQGPKVSQFGQDAPVVIERTAVKIIFLLRGENIKITEHIFGS